MVFDRWPFVVRMLWDPARAFDLVDATGSADHGKLLPATLMLAVLVLKVLGITFAWYELLILAALTGGVSLVRTLIKSGAIKGTGTAAISLAETVQHTITETRETHRDPSRGVEPTRE